MQTASSGQNCIQFAADPNKKIPEFCYTIQQYAYCSILKIILSNVESHYDRAHIVWPQTLSLFSFLSFSSSFFFEGTQHLYSL